MFRGALVVILLALVVAGCGGRHGSPPPGPGHLASSHCTTYNRSGTQYVTVYGPWAQAYLKSTCLDLSREFARTSRDFWSPYRGSHDYASGATLVCALTLTHAELDVYDQPNDRGGLATCRHLETTGWQLAG